MQTATAAATPVHASHAMHTIPAIGALNAETVRIQRPRPTIDALQWMQYDDTRFWRNLGERALGDRDGALALRCWMRVRDLEPQALDAMFHVGQSLVLLDEPMRACLVFDAIAANPAASDALRAQAAALAAEHEPIDLVLG